MKPDTAELRRLLVVLDTAPAQQGREAGAVLLRALPALLDELDRECVWSATGLSPSRALRTACGKMVSLDHDTDRPCWCGGKVRVEGEG